MKPFSSRCGTFFGTSQRAVFSATARPVAAARQHHPRRTHTVNCCRCCCCFSSAGAPLALQPPGVSGGGSGSGGSGGLSRTRPLLALEPVEVAHMRSYQHPSLRTAGSAPLAPPRSASSASPHYRSNAASSSGSGGESAGGYSMDYVSTADDTAGPAATRNSAAIVARSLGGSALAAERFYFRESHSNGNGNSRDGRDGGDFSIDTASRADADTMDFFGFSGQGGSDDGKGSAPSSSSSSLHHRHSNSRSSSSGGRRHGRGGGSGAEQMPFCALCREEIDPAEMSPRVHVVADSRASHTNHNCREVVLDSMALLGMRGYPVDSMYEVWSALLFYNDAFPRVRAWLDPRWSIEERAERLFLLLNGLKGAGLIDLTLAVVAPDTNSNNGNANSAYHHRRRVAFERLEYIGDNAWGTHVSGRIMTLFPDQQWQYSERCYGFNCFRDAVEMNVTNEIIFDAVRLDRLFPEDLRGRVGGGKIKADVVEALMGELHWALWSFEPKIRDDVAFVEVNGLGEDRVVAVLEHCLTELYDLIVLNYCRELSWNAVPLAKELAARFVWQGAVPRVRPQKSGRGGGRRNITTTLATATMSVTAPMGSVVSLGEDGGDGRPISTARTTAALTNIRYLPGVPRLFNGPVPYPRTVANPLRALTLKEIPVFTRSAFTGLDVFAEIIASYNRLGLVSDDAMQMFDIQGGGRGTATAAAAAAGSPRWGECISRLVPSINVHNGDGDSNGSGGGIFLEHEQAFFTDPYYNLFTAPMRPEATPLAPNSTGEEGGMQATAATPPPRMWGSLHLPAVTAVCPLAAGDRLRWTVDTAVHPPLRDGPETPLDESQDGQQQQQQPIGGADLSSFAPSRLVPPGLRTPSAGVVTVGNLYPGQFAFLGYDSPNGSNGTAIMAGGASDPVGLSLRSRPTAAAAVEEEEETVPTMVEAGEVKDNSNSSNISGRSSSDGSSTTADVESPEVLLRGAMGFWAAVNARRRASAEFSEYFVDLHHRPTPGGKGDSGRHQPSPSPSPSPSVAIAVDDDSG